VGRDDGPEDVVRATAASVLAGAAPAGAST
jgi:hypothetical protein